MHTIDILTGPVQSGKTTHLISWIKYHSKCAGILAPVVEKQRQFYSIHNEVYHPFEIKDGSESDQELITIGKYQFLNSSFLWARSQLHQAIELRPHWLIIDEIGPIEIHGEGLEPQVAKILNEYQRSRKNRLILVVREKLVDEVIKHYKIENDCMVHEAFLDII